MSDLSAYFQNLAQNSEGMPKQLVKDMVKAFRNWQTAQGQDPVKAELNMALFITAGAMLTTKENNGNDYVGHPIAVGFARTDSYSKKIIGILHDLVEDTDWTLEDLREVGFSDRIVSGVDHMTKREHEEYFDFIQRCGKNPDAIDVKLADLRHNSDLSRSESLMDFENPRDRRFIEKQRQVYVVAYNYLVAIKQEKIKPNTSVQSFMEQNPKFCDMALLRRWGTYRAHPSIH